jgi:phosphatidylglycerophosphatase A
MDKRSFAVAVATLGGIGFSPWCPGTVASAVTAVLWWFLPSLSLTMQFLILGLLSAFAIWTSTIAERYLGVHDPSCIVIDEAVGMVLALLGCPRMWWVYLLAFALFRLFDIVKPGPISRLQKLPRGWGIVMDDVAAGASARLVLMGLFYVLAV